MNKLEELHLDSLQKDKHVRKQLCVNEFGTSKLEESVATKSAEITEQIAIEFAEWIDKNNFKKFDIFENQMSCTHYKYQKWGKSHINSFTIEEEDTLTTKELFQEFLKQRQ